jgi:hypothetical protein
VWRSYVEWDGANKEIVREGFHWWTHPSSGPNGYCLSLASTKRAHRRAESGHYRDGNFWDPATQNHGCSDNVSVTVMILSGCWYSLQPQRRSYFTMESYWYCSRLAIVFHSLVWCCCELWFTTNLCTMLVPFFNRENIHSAELAISLDLYNKFICLNRCTPS